MKQLGELKRLSPRQVWRNESSEFTPWLRENISSLATTLGLELDLIEREAPVGDFSADLVAKDINSDRPVVIENQLDATNHSHLGQILTYAANRKAGVIVWIAPKFRDEHRQALEWLNDVTDENIDFFGLQLELLQIDDSAPAPNFSIVAKPSAWQRETRKRGQISERQKSYHDFFTTLLQELKSKSPLITHADNAGYGSGIGISAGKTGFSYWLSFTQDKRFRVELYLDMGEKDLNKKAFDLLKQEESQINQELGQVVEWERLDNKRACRIAVYRPDSQITNTAESLAEVRKWAVHTIIAFRKSMAPRILKLRMEGD